MAYGPPQSAYTSQTPQSQFADAGTCVGADVLFAVAGQITGLRYYRSSAAGGGETSRVLKLWNTGGTQVATANTTGDSGSGWKTASLATPFAVTAGQTFRVSTDSAGASTTFPFRNNITVANGDLTQTADYTGSGTGRPNSLDSTGSWFVDVVFEALIASTPGRPKVYAGGTWTAKPAKVYTAGGYGAAQSVFTTQTGTPGTSTQQTIGARIVIAAAGGITALRWLRPAETVVGITSRTLRLWDDATTPVQLAVASTSGESGPGWKEAVLATPYTVTAGQAVRVSIDNPDNMHTTTTTPTFPITNGDLSLTHAYRDAGGYPTPPTTSRTSHNFVDLVFQAGTAAGWTEKPMKRHNGTTWVALT